VPLNRLKQMVDILCFSRFTIASCSVVALTSLVFWDLESAVIAANPTALVIEGDDERDSWS